MSEDGCMAVDRHQRTDVPGLYAGGDVSFGLDQISHAMDEGGVAATSVRKDLDALRPMRRENGFCKNQLAARTDPAARRGLALLATLNSQCPRNYGGHACRFRFLEWEKSNTTEIFASVRRA